MERRLAAILAADLVGYSRLIREDEAGTLATLKAHLGQLIEPKIAERNGRIVKLMGDGLLAEFPSAVEAVQCAVEIQHWVDARNADVAKDKRTIYRIGINIGDIVVEGDDIYGDGVNVAARLEGLVEPGGICVARNVFDQVKDKLALTMEHLGERKVKNIAEPVSVYQVVFDDKAAALVTPVIRQVTNPKGWRWWAAIGVVAILAAIVGALVWRQPWMYGTGSMLTELPADLPAVAVLPFDNMSDDPEQDYFSDGITEDLITDLSRISGVFVIARTTVFTYKGKSMTVRQVGDELGVQYVLEGSVRRAGSRIRINAQLVDTRTGHHLWADRYDRELTDVFTLQDEITQRIVSVLAIKLTKDEQEQLGQSAMVHPEAYDMLLRGLEKYRRYTHETNAEAREFFEKAIALDPDFARAYADQALTYSEAAAQGWTDSPDISNQQALELAQRASAIDPTIREVHYALSNVYLGKKRYDDAITAAQRAIELDPNYADGHAMLGASLNFAGRPVEALEAIDKAMRLNPRYPFYYIQNEGIAHFLMKNYERAIAAFELVLERNPHFPAAHLLLAASYAQLGRIEDAEWQADEVLTLWPDFSLARERLDATYQDPEHLARYIESLRKAGLPE